VSGVSSADIARWRRADQAARPRRVELLRERMAREGVDAFFGVRLANTRYLTGFEATESEGPGVSGWFFVTAREVVMLADSRYTLQAAEQCPGVRIEPARQEFSRMWPGLLRRLGRGVRRVAAEAGFISQATWQRLVAAAPAVDLRPADGWVEQLRQTKEPAEIERVAASCAVADAALDRLLPSIRPGVTERELALALEWDMRTHGAEALAFDVACLAGERAALPHGSPTDRKVARGQVLLFDFGAQVCGYRSDMTRTLFVGEPRPRDRRVYDLVYASQQAALDAAEAAARTGRKLSGRRADAIARKVISDAGHGEHFGHGLGHGIGLATHELPSLAQRASAGALPSPTLFTIEPGVYLDGKTGVRIEDAVLYDTDARRFERLTRFPREVTVVGE
jgi:Xaa-Pro aminopeptidase